MASRNGIDFPFTDNVYNGLFQGATETGISIYDNTGWNMDANTTFPITHNLLLTEFREVSVGTMFISDDITPLFLEPNLDVNTNGTRGGILDLNNTTMTLYRVPTPTGVYDLPQYSSTILPRGFTTIWFRNT
jgi:hypothetical protein